MICDSQTRTVLKDKFPKIHALDPDFLPLTVCYLSVAYVFFHEFSHAFRGHLAYLGTVHLAEDDVLDMAAKKKIQNIHVLDTWWNATQIRGADI